MRARQSCLEPSTSGGPGVTSRVSTQRACPRGRFARAPTPPTPRRRLAVEGRRAAPPSTGSNWSHLGVRAHPTLARADVRPPSRGERHVATKDNVARHTETQTRDTRGRGMDRRRRGGVASADWARDDGGRARAGAPPLSGGPIERGRALESHDRSVVSVVRIEHYDLIVAVGRWRAAPSNSSCQAGPS